LDYPDYEIIVVNDGSTDLTKSLLEKKYKKDNSFTIIHLKSNSGLCKARNTGINAAKKEIIVMMDQDCIPENDWLKNLLKGFDSENVGMVSSFSSESGGTSTAFPRKVLHKVGLFDENFFFFREDSDLVFRILDAGYKTRRVKADFQHLHQQNKLKNLFEFIRYGIKRVKNHINDVLLFKKHPARAGKFLDVKFGFLANPWKDFGAATNLWHPKGKIALSSPQGITFIKPKTPLHIIIIILGGILYVLAVKTARLYGSIKFGKLLL
ncbi:glycosyltransferase family 2 protein, partial [Candidatus Micrarchaeota archaeon]|nr:glycosyltransferase family 2 protein [Candidatus Micrarchaeota archaeon]